MVSEEVSLVFWSKPNAEFECQYGKRSAYIWLLEHRISHTHILLLCHSRCYLSCYNSLICYLLAREALIPLKITAAYSTFYADVLELNVWLL